MSLVVEYDSGGGKILDNQWTVITQIFAVKIYIPLGAAKFAYDVHPYQAGVGRGGRNVLSENGGRSDEEKNINA